MNKFAGALAFVVLLAAIAATYSLCFGQGMMGRGGMHGGGMMHGGIPGRWHHIQMHGLPRDTSKMSFENRGRYVFRTTCADCHGDHGEGGVRNPNYEQGTVPALDELADSMGIFNQEDADQVVGILKKGDDPATKRGDPPFRGYARFVAQYESVRDTIEHGREAAKANPKGRQPQDMPAWGRTLDDRDVDAVIAHIIGLYDFPEKEDTDVPEEDPSFP